MDSLESPRIAERTFAAGVACESRAGCRTRAEQPEWGWVRVLAREAVPIAGRAVARDEHQSRSGDRPCNRGASPAESARSVDRLIGACMTRSGTEGAAEEGRWYRRSG